MSFRSGVVIGKFYPFHNGHSHLVNTAMRQCERVTVIVCWRGNDTIPGTARAEWIRETHPAVDRILVTDDRYDEDDTSVWAENTVRWLGGAPDAVFTSEDYGEEYARLLGARHVMVDQKRGTVPCVGREIRRNPWGNWEFISPPARAWYALRVCVVGAESTGKTTLANDLAQHYSSLCTEEYGRELTEIKMRSGHYEWHSEDFVQIAEEQSHREDAAARIANRVLICDTNALATTLWHRRYMGFENDAVARIAARRRYDLYILPGDEIPFVQDGLRDGEHIRHEMHEWFADLLRAQSVPWIRVEGTRHERLTAAAENIDAMLAQSLPENDAARGPFVDYPRAVDFPSDFVLRF